MRDLIENLTEYLNLTPEQQFRVSAMIKRNIHAEKASVFQRYFMYGQGDAIYDLTDPMNPKLVGREPAKDPWLNEIMEGKYKQHLELSELPDEKVITWSVGSFKYVQKIAPCSVCAVELTEDYTSIYADGVCVTFCPTHAPEGSQIACGVSLGIKNEHFDAGQLI
jgi:hypothetical protein